MVKVIYIDPDDNTRKIHSIYLENILSDIHVIQLVNIKQALNYLTQNREIHLIVSEAKTSQGTIVELYTYLKKNAPHLPLVLFSNVFPDEIKGLEDFQKINFRNSHLTKQTTPNEFRDHMLKVLRPGANLSLSVPAFHRVPSIYFWRFNRVLCDVYSKKSERQYSKILQKNQKYTREMIGQLAEKSGPFLYIKNSDFERFSVGFSRYPFMVEEKLSSEEEFDLAQTLKITHQILQNVAKSVGIDQTVVELSEKEIHEILQLAQSASGVNELLSNIQENKDYIYDHSYLLAVFSCATSLAFKLSDEQRKQLMIAALFHDITLDDPQIAMAQDLQELSSRKTSKLDIEIFKEHPFAAAKLLSATALYDPMVEKLLMGHHPQLTDSQEDQFLVELFLVLHKFVSLLYQHQLDLQELPQILTELKETYPQNSLLGVHQYLDQLKSPERLISAV